MPRTIGPLEHLRQAITDDAWGLPRLQEWASMPSDRVPGTPLARPTTARPHGTHRVQCGRAAYASTAVRSTARLTSWGEATMEHPVPRPDTMHALRLGADAAFAMLAGLQLDVFTPLQGGPLTTVPLAEAVGVGPVRLRLLLYALVAAGLLTEQDGRFANTPEPQRFLVQGTPTSLGPRHRHLAAQWAFKLHTAASLLTGVPQAHLDFAQASPEALEAFLRRINVSTMAAAQEVGARYDFATTRTLVDVGGGAGGLAVTLTQLARYWMIRTPRRSRPWASI